MRLRRGQLFCSMRGALQQPRLLQKSKKLPRAPIHPWMSQCMTWQDFRWASQYLLWSAMLLHGSLPIDAFCAVSAMVL